MIRLVVGLGNPGQEYKQTRHNAGFVFLDLLAGSDGWVFDSRLNGRLKKHLLPAGELILLKPDTFMNKSGVSVAAAQRFYKISPENVLVIHDEIELAEGVVKLKKGGGHGGHNGLRDIIAKTGSPDFFRLRIGVGRPGERMAVSDYVLSKMADKEFCSLTSLCGGVIDKLDVALSGDLDGFNSNFSVTA
ncbi:MAG: aminoacyl-tRNA hydrolase [Methylomonas sp.]|nr:MAG: aminoacyl-tRNA hydrolase [Methylomonas sp.]PPD24693.1 MAG: aminoacyl-tRNA hydrolase [Methylomonas sp.]PPD39800.1 MAG: aminoacyl-tRNA hydrolase [Methylomonas sp.]PPD51380.1 MAG: aminoacyl-tRNA hydrolase [Methylomonas sp.]